MSSSIQPSDPGFFVALVGAGSLTAAARELAVSPAAVSKRLAQLEARAGVQLVNRTTRRMSLTVEGDTYLRHARRILGELEDLEHQLGAARGRPAGLLRINATLGFGRSHVAPLVSRFVRRFPEVQIQLRLSAEPPSLMEDAFDICIRFGPPPDSRMVARKLADNRRLLCASPAYLARQGIPEQPSELRRHRFIGIRQGDESHGLLRLTDSRSGEPEMVRVQANLSTNDGGIAVQWALDGLGILMRAEWDIHRYLSSGRLVQVLSQYLTPDADIYAISAPRHEATARVREFLAFASQHFKSHPLAEQISQA